MYHTLSPLSTPSAKRPVSFTPKEILFANPVALWCALAASIAMMSATSALLSALLAGTAEGRTFAVAAGEGGPCAGGAVPLRHGSRRHEFPLLPSAAKYPA